MNSNLTLSLAAGLIVSAAALYASNDSRADACAAMQREAIKAAQAPLQPNSTAQLGFTPMSQFEKVYVPVCQPPNTAGDLISSILAGVFVSLGCLFFGTIFKRFLSSSHKEGSNAH